MGLTAVAHHLLAVGQRSGAHLNPAVTLAFWRLGKVEGWDALFYVLAQFVGGWLGVVLAPRSGRSVLSDPTVNFVATLPGEGGNRGWRS